MKLYLGFNELEEIIASKIDRRISINYCSNDTVALRVDLLVKIEVILKMLSIDNNLIVLQYDGNLAIKTVLSGLLMLFQSRFPMVSYDDDRKILIHLDKIENIDKVSDKVEIKGLSFDESNVILEGNIKQ